jgi:hybrid cluster-associated redox disulfide protein
MTGLPDIIDTLSLSEIMRIWPRTIRVFVEWHLHCIGCPISDLHRLADAADQHGCDRGALRSAILLAIEKRPV